MYILDTIDALRATRWQWQAQRVAFVPTMGNLHDGHLRLVQKAKNIADKVIVSIFVNPMQFGVGEDFASYPRTERDDIEKLNAVGVDVLFLPSVSVMYAASAKTVVSINSLSTLHCGAVRGGHFDGVATVVCKLFNIVQPDVALFGLKDYQQLAIIRTLVDDLNLPIDIIGVPTVREMSGLAMSSRNAYLSESEKYIAPVLYQTLLRAQTAVLIQQQSYRAIEQTALTMLQQAGFSPDYFTICRRCDLQIANAQDMALVILAAARLGKARLIDNIEVSL